MHENTANELIIPYPNGKISATYRAGNPLVVFSHGFGVERTSAGMFTDIAKSLPLSWGFIMFDYPEINRHVWTVCGLADMKLRLEKVLEYGSQEATDVVVIAHSLGCAITALSSEKIHRTIFLAPPTRTITENWKLSFVTHRKGRASLDKDGNVRLTRKSDQQKMIIKDAWFKEMVSMPAFLDMKRLARAGKLDIIEAREDADIKDRRRYKTLVNNGANLLTIPGNHNFDPPHREQLISTILDLLQ